MKGGRGQRKDKEGLIIQKEYTREPTSGGRESEKGTLANISMNEETKGGEEWEGSGD